MSWPVAHAAFAGRADPVPAELPAPVACLGIDDHLRGRARWRIDPGTGEYMLLADRWHTCFYHLSGGQGLLDQVEGWTADDAAYWLAQQRLGTVRGMRLAWDRSISLVLCAAACTIDRLWH